MTKCRRRVDVRVREDQLRVGRALRLRGGDPGAQQVLRRPPRLLYGLVVEQAELAQKHLEPSDAFARALLLDAREVDVRTRVVRGRVRCGAVVDALDEGGAAARPRPLDRL